MNRFALFFCFLLANTFASISYTAPLTNDADHAKISSSTIDDKQSSPTNVSLWQRFKTFFSPTRQWRFIMGYEGFLLLQNFLHDIVIYKEAQPVKNIPEPLNYYLRKNTNAPYDSDIFTSKLLGFNATALSNGTIIFGEELFNKCSLKQLNYVLGHEVAHVDKRHNGKEWLLTGLLICMPIIIDTLMDKLKAHTAKNKNTVLKGVIQRYETIKKFILQYPLVLFFSYKYLLSKMSCHFEKEADLQAAQNIGNIDGGLSFFKKYQQLPSAYHYLNPYHWMLKFEETFFPSHPSCDTRINYLMNEANNTP